MNSLGLESKESVKKQSIFRKLLEVRELTLLIIIVLICAALSILSPYFLTGRNAMVILMGISIELIVAVGVTIGLLSGHIDFSVGSTLGVCGFLGATMIKAGFPIVIAILLTLLAGIVLGMVNGFLIIKLKIIPIVVTMGTWMAYKGFGLIITQGRTMANFPAEFNAIGQTWNLFGIPFIIVVMIVCVIIGALLLKYSRFFRQTFFIGSNKHSAELAGIKVDRFIVTAYGISGLMSAMAGTLLISRLGSAPASLGQGLEFRVVTGLLIGGISFFGGEGTILGTVLGVLLMGIITNALAILGITTYLQTVIIGFILIASVGIDEANKRRKERA